MKKVGKEYSLKELVEAITPQNRHSEVDFGHPVGKEKGYYKEDLICFRQGRGKREPILLK